MIELKITGDVFEVLADMTRLIGHVPTPVGAFTSDENHPAVVLVDENDNVIAVGTDIVESTAPPAEKTPRKRRTKAEMEAARAEPGPEIITSPEPQISSGEERVGPEDSPEVQAQDAADEAAESAAAKTKLTHDDLRRELGLYVTAYGMPATLQDGPKLLALALPDLKPLAISGVPDDQELLAKVLAGLKEMREKNPYDRGPGGPVNG
jgi:hypothetical protein